MIYNLKLYKEDKELLLNMFEITDEKERKKIIFLLNNLWCGKSDHFFPYQMCEYIEKKDLFKLSSFEYYYYKKNTKIEKRGILFLFTDSSGDKKPVLILRDFSIYILNIDCHFEYYRNSIFDVTLFGDKIVIYDTIYISGVKINTYEFIERITEAENFKKNTYNPTFVVCEYSKEISTLIESIIPYEEEIFIVSNNFPIIVGINRGCFKWQPSEHVYISLKVEEIQSDLLLYATNYKKDVPFAKIHSSDEHGKMYIDNIKKLDKYKNGCVIDICFTEKENENNEESIKILRLSDNYPASIRYIEKLLYFKKENITKHDLIR
jgi:hypothetical protein